MWWKLLKRRWLNGYTIFAYLFVTTFILLMLVGDYYSAYGTALIIIIAFTPIIAGIAVESHDHLVTTRKYTLMRAIMHDIASIIPRASLSLKYDEAGLYYIVTIMGNYINGVYWNLPSGEHFDQIIAKLETKGYLYLDTVLDDADKKIVKLRPTSRNIKQLEIAAIKYENIQG